MKDLFIYLSHTKYRGQELCYHLAKYNYKWLNEKKKKESVNINSIYEAMQNNHVKILEDPLPSLALPPYALYAKGQGSVTEKRVAIIGSRKCTSYGKKIAEKLAYKLAKKGVTVVSGLAYGIDKAAHIGAIKAEGVTLAVLGSGLLNCYPKSHQWLYDKIVRNGYILSEYGLYAKPYPQYFPFRNRIIAGLSQAIVVVEAQIKSGTMITVGHALDQGKDVYVIPGPVDSPFSKGTHHLIKQGASIIVDLNEFVEEIVKG